MNIDWARRTARKLTELGDKIKAKPDHPLTPVWKASLDESSQLLERYGWQVSEDGKVEKKPKKTK